MNLVPIVFIYSLIWSAISRSKRRNTLERTINYNSHSRKEVNTDTSKPSVCKNPAHSKAIYEAPTISVLPSFMNRSLNDLPGGLRRENKSSLVIAYSRAPGIFLCLHSHKEQSIQNGGSSTCRNDNFLCCDDTFLSVLVFTLNGVIINKTGSFIEITSQLWIEGWTILNGIRFHVLLGCEIQSSNVTLYGAN